MHVYVYVRSIRLDSANNRNWWSFSFFLSLEASSWWMSSRRVIHAGYVVLCVNDPLPLAERRSEKKGRGKM